MTESPLPALLIRNLSHEGRGIGEIAGKTTFVDGALPGELVEVSLHKKHKRYNDAKLERVLETSLERIKPTCAHFLLCGGCSLQHLATNAQIQFKQSVLAEQFHHFANQLKPQHWLAPLTADPWHYRRKARLGVKYVQKKEKVLVGFREKRSNKIAMLTQCEILDKRVGTQLEGLAALIESLEAFEQMPQIEVAAGDNACALVFRHLVPLSETDLQSLIHFGKTHHFWIYLQAKGPESVIRIHPEISDEKLFYELNTQKLKLYFEPYHFTQVNARINEKMITQAIELLALNPQDIILDLFSGLGNFSLALAKQVKTVIALEGEQALCDYGDYNAKYNQISNCRFIQADLHDEISLGKDLPWPALPYTKALIDPPRTGAKALLEQLATLGIAKILYVSCNPATLARDAAILVKNGYVLKTAGVMDMFPHTNHVESMALFQLPS